MAKRDELACGSRLVGNREDRGLTPQNACKSHGKSGSTPALDAAQRSNQGYGTVMRNREGKAGVSQCDIEWRKSPSCFRIQLRTVIDKVLDDAVCATGRRPVQSGFSF